MRNSLLAIRLQALAEVPGLSPAAVAAIAAFLAERPAPELFRFTLRVLDPGAAVPDGELADALVTAAGLELLVMEWCLVCQECTGIILSARRFSGFGGAAILCPFCNKRVAPDFQENVEIAFSPHPSLGCRKPDAYRSLDAYQRHHFSRSFVNGGLKRYLPSGLLLAHAAVGPGRKLALPFRPQPGREYNLFSVDGHVLFRLRCVPEAAASPSPEIRYLGERNDPVPVDVPPSAESLTVINQSRGRIGVSLLECGEWSRFLQVFAEYPLRGARRVMGSRILLNPAFIRLFGHQTLTDSFSFQVGRLSILFTDLKGSTALYSRLGDLGAFGLVGRHFDVLHQAVADCGGIVIKTIGDAVMAVFHERAASVRCAVAMHRAMERAFGDDPDGRLELKVGIHHGTVLAVNANQRLDYFGQSVNIAARIQNEAGGGEICLSGSVLDDEAARFLEAEGWRGELRRLELRGVGEETAVHRFRRVSQAARRPATSR